jgi:protein-S-isoprenylcysteine O-methyltransferase Ste14
MTDHPDTANVIAPPPLMAAAALVVGLLLDRLAPAYVLTVMVSVGVRITIGLVLMAAGGALGFAAVRAFRAAGTAVRPWKPSSMLVTNDVFGWVRNPMYVGLILLLAGFAFMVASDWTLVMTTAFALALHFGVIKREERYLEAKFGDAFRAYRKRVRRYGWPPFGFR